MGWALVVAFLVVPIVEIYVIVQVGQVIGAVPTVVLLLVESLLGAWLVRHEGSRAWRTLQTAVATGQLPTRELSDAALVLIGGTLLLTPGFVTDVVGFFFVLPFTRPVARRALAAYVARRARVQVARFGGFGGFGGPAGRFGPTGSSGPAGPAGAGGGSNRVVPGQVVHEDEPGTTPPEASEDDERPGRTPR